MRAAAQAEGATAPSLRDRVEAAIERMIAMLDEIDGDENLEPSVSGCGYMVLDDREGDVQDEPHDVGDEGNDEPSLG